VDSGDAPDMREVVTKMADDIKTDCQELNGKAT
jgi:predicted nucleic acid-binding Zn ribbon protein